MRLNVWFGKRENGRGYQANLANSGDGWTVEYHPDPLEAITKALSARFGAALLRERLAAPEDDEDSTDSLIPDDIADALSFVLSRRGIADAEMAAITEEVVDQLWESGQPKLHEVDAPDVDSFESLL